MLSDSGKVGRNHQCPCGSGLKYKRCHGSIVDPRTGPGNLELDATEGRLSLGSFPGQHQKLHQMFRFKAGDPRNDLPPLGSTCDYEVVFVLQRPGYALLPERQISFSAGHAGDSHLAISQPAFKLPGHEDADQIGILADNEDGHFEFIGTPNKKGFLGKLTSRPFRAPNRLVAEEMAYRAVAPSLSLFSTALDIPLEIAQTETKDLLSHNVHISFTTPFREVPFAVNATAVTTPDFRGIASLYREGMNTNSPVFQFLCFFKIIEALRARRTKLGREAKRNGLTYTPPVEIFPTTDAEVVTWLNALFYVRSEWDLMALGSAVPLEVRGKTIESTVDEILLPLRVNVAHALFLDKGGELNLSSDDLLDTGHITKRLVLTKCIVRRMLKNDFPSEFLNHLPG
jgi:hypothetical protein